MNPYRIILNPVAGHGNGTRLLPQITAALAQEHLPYDLIQTTARGDALAFAAQAVEDGVQVIVAAGGDGTLNEVVNGIMAYPSARRPILGVLGVGRGNDFAGSVGIPAEMDSAVHLLKEAPIQRIDIGRVTGGIFPQGRYFINCVGVGFDVIATIEAAKLPRWGGFLSFMLAIFRTIFLYNHAPLARIEYGSTRIEQRSLLISVMNGRRLGGGFYLAPNSKQDDGLFDLCIAEQMTSLNVIRMLPYFMKGTQASQKEIKTGSASRVTITGLDGPLPAQTDGEIFSTEGRELKIEVCPREIDVIIPRA